MGGKNPRGCSLARRGQAKSSFNPPLARELGLVRGGTVGREVSRTEREKMCFVISHGFLG